MLRLMLTNTLKRLHHETYNIYVHGDFKCAHSVVQWHGKSRQSFSN